MSEETTKTAFDWARWIVGTVVFCGMLYVHVFHKEIPLILFGVPAFLVGIKPEGLLSMFGGKK